MCEEISNLFRLTGTSIMMFAGPPRLHLFSGTDCLTGNRRVACPAPFAKIFSFSSAANHFTVHRYPALTRGAYRDRHGRWVRDAMDAGDVKRRMTLRADGEVVWS
jgi:hypothetical protein